MVMVSSSGWAWTARSVFGIVGPRHVNTIQLATAMSMLRRAFNRGHPLSGVSASTRELAHQVLDGATFDFGRLLRAANVLVAQPDRHGVRVVVLPTSALPEPALRAILAWRLGQYLLTGFYDAEGVRRASLRGESQELVGPDDLHALAIDHAGAILCYATVKQPHGVESRTWGAADRPKYPCEEVHGVAWQAHLVGLLDTPAEHVWEWARFCKDQRRGRLDAAVQRAPLELALALVQLVQRPAAAGHWQVAVGDFDPAVALRNLRYFFIAAATFTPHYVARPEGDLLAPRYAQHLTAPFVATTADIDDATYLRWVDIEFALSFGHREAARRLLALRQLVSVKESRLKRPIASVDRGPYPRLALENASAQDVSAAMWAAAAEGQLPGWQAAAFGPGEYAPADRVVWSLDGYLQAFIGRHEDNGYLGGIGAWVACVPQPGLPPIIALRAATPVRVLMTDRASFEDFWARRQRCFETSTASLYGEVTMETST